MLGKTEELFTFYCSLRFCLNFILLVFWSIFSANVGGSFGEREIWLLEENLSSLGNLFKKFKLEKIFTNLQFKIKKFSNF